MKRKTEENKREVIKFCLYLIVLQMQSDTEKVEWVVMLHLRIQLTAVSILQKAAEPC